MHSCLQRFGRRPPRHPGARKVGPSPRTTSLASRRLRPCRQTLQRNSPVDRGVEKQRQQKSEDVAGARRRSGAGLLPQHTTGQPPTEEEKQRITRNFGYAEHDEAAQVITPVPTNAASRTTTASSSSAVGSAAQKVIKRTLKNQDSDSGREGAARKLMDEFDRMQDEQRHEMDTEEMIPDGRQPQTTLQAGDRRHPSWNPAWGAIEAKTHCQTKSMTGKMEMVFQAHSRRLDTLETALEKEAGMTRQSMAEVDQRITMGGNLRERENAEKIDNMEERLKGLALRNAESKGTVNNINHSVEERRGRALGHGSFGTSSSGDGDSRRRGQQAIPGLPENLRARCLLRFRARMLSADAPSRQRAK